MKKVLLATLLTAGAIAFAAQPTFAANDTVGEQAQKQSISREIEWHCDPGSYGQNRTCYFKDKFDATQEQRQKILAAQIGGRKLHVPVDTAVTMSTIMMVFAAAALGFGATYGLVKLK